MMENALACFLGFFVFCWIREEMRLRKTQRQNSKLNERIERMKTLGKW